MSVFDEITETIAQTIGPGRAADVVRAIRRNHAGSVAYVPAVDAAARRDRNNHLRQSIQSGADRSRASRQHGISKRHSYRVSR